MLIISISDTSQYNIPYSLSRYWSIVSVDDVTIAVLSELQVIRLWFGTIHHLDCTGNLTVLIMDYYITECFFITVFFLNVIQMIASPL